MAVIWFALGCFGAIGLLAALLRWPTRLDAAMEADRQLKLADLLSTALSVRGSADTWAMTVLALAEQRCRAVSPAAVLLNRWGARAWGGVGLATALVLTLGLVSTRSATSQAGDSPVNIFAGQDNLGVSLAAHPSVAYSPLRQPIVRQNASDDPDMSTENGGQQTADKAVADKGGPSEISIANPRQPSAGDPTRSGAGAAGTSGTHSSMPLPSDAASGTHRISQSLTAGGGQSDGASDDGKAKSAVASGMAGQRTQRADAPPWTSSTWGDASQRALQQSASHIEYEGYRDLIREYFQRH